MKNKSLTSKDRLHYLDNLKCLLIFLVVLTHFLLERTQVEINTFVKLIYCFHMPVFVFVSGFFSKSENSSSHTKLIKLLIIYVLSNAAFTIMMGITGTLQLVTPFFMTWYLIALVVWRIMAKHLAKIKGILPITIAIAILCGFFPDVTNVLAISRIISFLPFFMAGYLVTNEQLEKFRKIKVLDKIFITIVAVLTIVVLAIFFCTTTSFTLEALTMDPYETLFDAGIRTLIMLFAAVIVIMCVLFSIDKPLPIITKCGKNSLTIYVFHRIFTLAFNSMLLTANPLVVFIVATICTILIMLLFGSDTVHTKFNEFIDAAYDILFDKTKTTKLSLRITAVATTIILVGLQFVTPFIGSNKFLQNSNSEIMYNRITKEQQEKFDNAYTITFSGDLILLEDQVKRAYDGTNYNFDNMFTYTKDILSQADLTIGVFEGPMAGEDKGYSNGNYDDGKALALNYPDSFASTIKNVGYDLVSTANNHLLDKGVDGMERTIDILDQVGLDHIGSYKNATDKQANNIYVLESDGLKFCVLAYTYGVNGYDTNALLQDYSYATSIIASPGSFEFDKTKRAVEEDFEKAKALNPDFIIVMPHWGEQFITSPDLMEKTWENIFIENGADIILGDHTHSVQPTKIVEHNNKNVFVAYCPGNYTNLYQENDGDACVLTHTYIDKTTKTIIGGAITPMWGYAQANGNYAAIPIEIVLNDESVHDKLTLLDIARAKEVHSLITTIQFGKALNLDLLTTHYYFDNTGLLTKMAPTLDVVDELKTGVLYNEMKNHSSICFIGDSITAGSLNGGYGWYEPLLSYTSATVTRVAYGGATVKTIIDSKNKIPSASLYIIAIGTNDVRYRNNTTCAMTSQDYVTKINELTNIILAKNNNAKFVYIAPFISLENDTNTMLTHQEKIALIQEYSAKLKTYADNNNHIFIDINTALSDVFSKYIVSNYMLDAIHPNSSEGIKLYAKLALEY